MGPAKITCTQTPRRFTYITSMESCSITEPSGAPCVILPTHSRPVVTASTALGTTLKPKTTACSVCRIEIKEVYMHGCTPAAAEIFVTSNSWRHADSKQCLAQPSARNVKTPKKCYGSQDPERRYLHVDTLHTPYYAQHQNYNSNRDAVPKHNVWAVRDCAEYRPQKALHPPKGVLSIWTRQIHGYHPDPKGSKFSNMKQKPQLRFQMQQPLMLQILVPGPPRTLHQGAFGNPGVGGAQVVHPKGAQASGGGLSIRPKKTPNRL